MNKHRFAPGVSIGVCLALGAALGAAIGHVGLGVIIGLVVGVVYAGASRRLRSEDAQTDGDKPPPGSA